LPTGSIGGRRPVGERPDRVDLGRREDADVSDLTAEAFAEYLRDAVLVERQTGNPFGLYNVESVELDGAYPDTNLVLRANTRRTGRIGWRLSLFDGQRDWERLRNIGLYADVNRFVSEVIVELDEGIDGEVFKYGEADEQGVRWVTNRWQS